MQNEAKPTGNDATVGFVPIGDGPLHRYRIRGSGPPLILCAGTGYPLDTWPLAFLEPLAEHFTVVEFDYRGTGGTIGTEGPYSTRGFARDVANVAAALGLPRCAVLGHSMGGRVAQWMAIDAPEQVAALVLVASGAGEGLRSGQEAGVPLRVAEQMISLGFRAYLHENVRKLFFTREYLQHHPATLETLVESFWQNRPSVLDYLKHVQARQQHSTADVLQQISQPTLVLIGSEDDFAGGTGSHVDQSVFLAESIPSAEMTFIQGCAHGVFWQDPSATADAVIRWLSDQALRSTPIE